jgi:tRNA (guanine-N7-)-methyltransferase
MSLRGKKRLPLEALRPFEIHLPHPAQADLWDGPTLFGNARPFEVEVGCGQGGFLIGRAAQLPMHNFLGVEIDRARQHYVATRLARRGYTNVLVALGDARILLETLLRPGCVSQLHIYYPDPWWKRRHHKRRLFQPAFVRACARVLAPGGKLHLASDVPDYFALMTRLVRDLTPLTEVPEEVSALMAGIGPTNYERKGLARGHVVGRASFLNP